MMIKRVFFDANIILDMIDSDRANVENVRKLVYNALIKELTLYTSCDILSNIYYVARKKLDKETLVKEMLNILEIFEIVAIDKALAKKALLDNQMNHALDFEDLLQRQCAEVTQCDLIVTNDKKFIKGKVKHLSLVEALKVV
jgi:predicted nucleic acid-binding protein